MIGFQFSSCKKQDTKTQFVKTSVENNDYLRGITALHNIAVDYSQFSNFKATNGGSYIEMDSVENGLEVGYNYYVSIPNHNRMAIYDGFNFDIGLSKPDSLEGTEIGIIFSNIQDSLMALLTDLDDGTFHLSLMDLEFEPDPTGAYSMTVFVNYSFAYGDDLPENLPMEDTTTVYITDYDSNPPTSIMCTPAQLAYPQSLMSITGLGTWQNQYFNGKAQMNFSTNGLVSGTKSCDYPGAAILMRKFGIDDYYSNYSSPSSLFVTNISGLVYDYNFGSIPQIDNPYLIKGLGDYDDFVIFWNNPPDVSGYHPDYSGNHIHGLWINNQMIDFYVSYIPGIINSNIPSGKYFKDMHIANTVPTNGDYQKRWFYHIYFGSRRIFNDQLPADKVTVDTYNSPIIF